MAWRNCFRLTTARFIMSIGNTFTIFNFSMPWLLWIPDVITTWCKDISTAKLSYPHEEDKNGPVIINPIIPSHTYPFELASYQDHSDLSCYLWLNFIITETLVTHMHDDWSIKAFRLMAEEALDWFVVVRITIEHPTVYLGLRPLNESPTSTSRLIVTFVCPSYQGQVNSDLAHKSNNFIYDQSNMDTMPN